MGFNFHGNNFSNSKFFFLFFCFFVLGYITKSTVMICPMLKSVIFFFHCWHVHRVGAALAPCRRSDKKKKDTARTPKSSEPYQYPCLTHVRHRYFAKMAC